MKQPKNFEDGIARLEVILDKISDESTPLNDSLKLYAEAAELVAYCNGVLEKAQLQIEEVDARLQGSKEQEEIS